MKAGVCLGRRSGQTPMRIPRHIGVLRMPSGASYYGPSYISPDQITGKEEGTSFGFTSELWLVRHRTHDAHPCLCPLALLHDAVLWRLWVC